jgi:hypothetical protein
MTIQHNHYNDKITPSSGILDVVGTLRQSGLPIIANTVTALSISSGVVNIDCALGDYFTLTLTANVTSITFSNLPGSGKGANKVIRIVQGASAYTVAWPSTFAWVDGTQSVVSTASGKVDMLEINTFDNGTRWEASLTKALSIPIFSSLLLRANTANGSTPVDDSPNAFVPTGTTGIVQSAAAKYGAAGMDFGTSSLLDYTYTASGPFDFGSGDFTIQGWVNPNSALTDVQCLFNIRKPDGSYVLNITFWTGTEAYGIFELFTAGGNFSATYANVPTGSWMHLAFVRDGNTVRVYKNGVQAVSATGGSGAMNTGSDTVRMGGQNLASGNPRRMDAYVDDFQVIKGTCLYPAGTTFTPPGAL